MTKQRQSDLFKLLTPASTKAIRECARNMDGPEKIESALEGAILPELLKFNSGELAEFTASIIAQNTTRQLAKAVLDLIGKKFPGMDEP